MSTTKQKESQNISLKDMYPYWDKIRAMWIANQSHCDPDSPSKRKNLIEKGITFAPEWTGEIGFLRYYLFHVDNSYTPQKSILQRIDVNKGFSPENCKIVHKGKSKLRIPDEPVKETVSSMNVTNNFIIIDNPNKADTIIKALLSNLNVQSLALVDKTD